MAHGIEFDRAIYEHILVVRHGFPPLPLDIQHCSMSLALANAYPAELARRAPRWKSNTRRTAKAPY